MALEPLRTCSSGTMEDFEGCSREGTDLREPILASSGSSLRSESQADAQPPAPPPPLEVPGALDSPLVSVDHPKMKKLRMLRREGRGWESTAKAAGLLTVLALVAAVVSVELGHTAGRRGPAFSSTSASKQLPQLRASIPVFEQCPGTIPVGGMDDIALTNAKWNIPGKLGGDVLLGQGGVVVPYMWGRAYFATSCETDKYSNSRYASIELLGKTLQYTVDLSGASCGCNAALYLASMQQNTEMSMCTDYYCDAASVCGVTCSEIDIQEANKFAWHSTLHLHDDPAGASAGYGGKAQNTWLAGDYGPGGRCVDTQAPIKVAASFPVDATGGLQSMDVVLSQDGKPCTLSQSVGAYAFKGRNGMAELSTSLAAGMVPIVSYWSSADMLWLDGKTADGKGNCVVDDPSTCPDSVKFYDFSVFETAPGGAPAAATGVTTPASPSPAPPVQTTSAPDQTTSAPETVLVPISAPSSLPGYTLKDTNGKAVCQESHRLPLACGNCGPNWGDLNKCKDSCDASSGCKFLTYFSDKGCRIYSACSSTWDHPFSVTSTIYGRDPAPAGQPAPAPADQPAPAPAGAPSVTSAPATSYVEVSPPGVDVCDEAARLPAPCGFCGPNWGDFDQCASLCDVQPQCKFITYFDDRGCRLYSKCDSKWQPNYFNALKARPTRFSIYRKGT